MMNKNYGRKGYNRLKARLLLELENSVDKFSLAQWGEMSVKEAVEALEWLKKNEEVEVFEIFYKQQEIEYFEPGVEFDCD